MGGKRTESHRPEAALTQEREGKVMGGKRTESHRPEAALTQEREGK
jgi:hypothetical protein